MTTPTRRIRNARLRYPRSHAAARACILTARLRSKDIALRAVARAGDDAMLAADALRLERDAAHEECARLAAERDHARAIAVALEQEAAVRYSDTRVPMDSDRAPEDPPPAVRHGRPGHRGRRHHRPARPRVARRPQHEGGDVKPTRDQIAIAVEAIIGAVLALTLGALLALIWAEGRRG